MPVLHRGAVRAVRMCALRAIEITRGGQHEPAESRTLVALGRRALVALGRPAVAGPGRRPMGQIPPPLPASAGTRPPAEASHSRPSRRRRGWLIAGAAVAVLFILGLIGNLTDDKASTTGSKPQTFAAVSADTSSAPSAKSASPSRSDTTAASASASKVVTKSPSPSVHPTASTAAAQGSRCSDQAITQAHQERCGCTARA